jgi:hypothetical protein
MSISQREYRDVANRRRTGFSDRLPRHRPTAPERHTRKCAICSHRNREAIESAFLCWSNPGAIIDEFHLNNRQSLYRHARATGLDELRRHKLSCAAEMFIEHAADVQPDAGDVLRAIYVVSHIDADGRWRKPARITEPRGSSNRYSSARLETPANA